MHTTTRNHIAYVFTEKCINPLNALVAETCPYIDRLIRDRAAAKTDVESYTRRLRNSESKLEHLKSKNANAESIEKALADVNKLRGKLQRSQDAYERFSTEAKTHMKKLVHERFDHVHREFGALIACQVAFFTQYSKSLEESVKALGKPYQESLQAIEDQIKSGTLPETEDEICPPLANKFWSRQPRLSFSMAPYVRSQSVVSRNSTGDFNPPTASATSSSSASSVLSNANPYKEQLVTATAPTSPYPTDGSHCEATFTFQPQEANELPFSKGDIIKITAQEDEGWWQGINLSSGKQGVFPSNYVKVLK